MHNKHWIWVLLAAPATLILYQFGADAITYGQTIHQSGYWSVALLFVALSLTPLQRVTSKTVFVSFLMRQRRAIGIASFAYAALHTSVYLERKWGADLIVKEALDPALGLGWLALFVFLILAVTSNDKSVRMLRARWKTLHRSIYFAAALTFIHWILATFDPLPAYFCLALILLIEMSRFTSAKS
jgi:sulfoxide reductase heme-binding subunit YedZ